MPGPPCVQRVLQLLNGSLERPIPALGDRRGLIENLHIRTSPTPTKSSPSGVRSRLVVMPATTPWGSRKINGWPVLTGGVVPMVVTDLTP